MRAVREDTSMGPVPCPKARSARKRRTDRSSKVQGFCTMEKESIGNKKKRQVFMQIVFGRRAYKHTWFVCPPYHINCARWKQAAGRHQSDYVMQKAPRHSGGGWQVHGRTASARKYPPREKPKMIPLFSTPYCCTIRRKWSIVLQSAACFMIHHSRLAVSVNNFRTIVDWI